MACLLASDLTIAAVVHPRGGLLCKRSSECTGGGTIFRETSLLGPPLPDGGS
jgi:hypothetical protein